MRKDFTHSVKLKIYINIMIKIRKERCWKWEDYLEQMVFVV